MYMIIISRITRLILCIFINTEPVRNLQAALENVKFSTLLFFADLLFSYKNESSTNYIRKPNRK
jgi:hypothetical protein